jgi:2-C-methyl-D-erythritol 4-phosphate cytidylyltransferase
MQSVYNGLIEAEGCDIALIHDGARPFVSQKVIKDCIESVRRCGSGVASIP